MDFFSLFFIEVIMTYYERISFLIGESNEMCTYLFSNVIRLISFYDKLDKSSKVDPTLLLDEIEVYSSNEYLKFINMSLKEKENLFSNSKLSLKVQKTLLAISSKQIYLNNSFFIEYDNGFSSEDVKIYEKAISSIEEHNNNIKETNLKIIADIEKLKKQYLQIR